MKHILILIVLTTPSLADEVANWNLLTQSEGGTVSLVKSLTKHECEFALHWVKGEPATPEEVAAEEQRQTNIRAEAEDVCAHPDKYKNSADHVDAVCRNGHAINLDGFSQIIQLGNIKLAECFQ